MYARTFAADTGAGSSAQTDVATELIALRADISGLADSVMRLAAETPDRARESIETSIRGNPLRGTVLAAGIGFVLAFLVAR